tara:strand:+ start:139 stop:1296 length:1158 start_codon:yes stop_codon:yes gene_type:complete
MKRILLAITTLFFLVSCDSLTGLDNQDSSSGLLYVTLQGTNKVTILNASTLNLIEEVDISLSVGIGMELVTTPHYVVVDEVNGYWFISAIMSNTIAMYSVDTNELIDVISVYEDPAILDIDTSSKKLYSSRMMIMEGMQMGSETNFVDEISYNSNGMTLVQSYDSGSPTPHGLSLNDNGNILITASNTTDFVSKINTISGEISQASLDSNINDVPSLEINRLKPLEIVQNNGYAFISCTGGVWQNTNTGEYEDIHGQVQVWDVLNMQKINTYQFSVDSKPWHIDYHPYEDRVYVVLSGSSNSENSAGIACLSFQNDMLSLDWETKSSDFNALHGIAISSDGQFVYVSGRGDGNIYKFDANSGLLLKTVNIVPSGMTRTGGIAVTQ